MSETELRHCVFEVDPIDATKVRCVRGGCANRMTLIPGLAISDYLSLCQGGRPGVVQRAANFAKAVVKDVAAGRPRRTPEQVSEIITICQSNQCGLYNPQQGWCEHFACGCDLEKKAQWSEEHCPVGLW